MMCFDRVGITDEHSGAAYDEKGDMQMEAACPDTTTPADAAIASYGSGHLLARPGQSARPNWLDLSGFRQLD